MKISLIQIGDSFGNQHYLPYTVGLLQAYAQSRLADPNKVQFGLPIYRRMPPAQAVDQLAGSDLLVFSVYIWNQALSREIALLYRQSYPEALIVFGGPQIPENKLRLEHFMEENPFINIACYTEGEHPFLKILENFDTRAWENVPGIAFHQGNDIKITAPADQINDLDLLPSPYLAGVFDPLIEQSPEANWSALIETNRGCPFTCAFCYWGAGSRRHMRSYSLERVYAEIDWLAQHKIEFVFCCDANFGILPRDMEIVEHVAELKAHCGYPRAFSVQSTKNSTAKIFALQKRLNDAGLQKGVNVALQSLHLPTLDAIDRSNIKTETYTELLTQFNSASIPAFSDLILGLPEESYDSYTRGVEQVIRQGQHSRIQFINLTVLENTAMADLCYIKRYGLQLVSSQIVSHHSSLTEQSGVSESQRLVVGTAAMPPADWVKARIYSWFLSLFYFDRLFQIPFILLDRLAGIGPRKIAEHCISQGIDLPTMGKLLAIMRENALKIQTGSPEYVPASDFLNIWWPLDEYLLIRLTNEGMLDQLYAETSQLLASFASHLPMGLLEEALRLNRALVKEPFVTTNIEIELSFAIPELYFSFRKGAEMRPEKGTFKYLIDRTSQHWDDWESWMREMVWYGGKKGDYLYPCRVVGAEEKQP